MPHATASTPHPAGICASVSDRTSRRPATGSWAFVGLLVLLLLVGPGAAAAADQPHRWPLANARVSRPFDPPDRPWLTGHRGVDLAAAAGTTVGASAAGVVSHAGAVAGRGWVTVSHADGIRTTYGPLAQILVSEGAGVSAGGVLGTVADDARHDGLHWSARRGDVYLDPLGLLTGIVVPSLVLAPDWRAADMRALPRYEPWDGRDTTFGLLPHTREATAPGWLSAPTPNHVVAVAGLLTGTGSLPLEVEFLGYGAADVSSLSHASDHGPYGPGDTFLGVHRSALLLEAHLRAQWAREPGVAVDLVGHSFGGVVVLHYLLALHDPADPGLPPIANVVTLSSPLEGADLASLGVEVAEESGPLGGVAALASAVLGVDVNGGTLRDLAVGSALLRDLSTAWQAAQDDPHRSPLASGTRVLTIGASRDPVVPDHRADLPGAPHVVVPGGHSSMHDTEAVLQVVRAFLEGRPVPAGNAGWGAWLSPGWSAVEQVLVALV